MGYLVHALLPAVALSGSADGSGAGAGAGAVRGVSKATNVLFVVVDNFRPAMGAYGNAEVVTPHMDALAANATLFSRAFCQEAWCSPSRNSFLTGRVPDVTQVWNFKASFRTTATGAPGAGANWTTLPGHFKAAGYYASSSGKVFHPSFPTNFDYPASWSDQPILQEKYDCSPPNCSSDLHQPCGLMGCTFAPNGTAGTAAAGALPLPTASDADTLCADLVLARLKAWAAAGRTPLAPQRPFFIAAGFQSPRLPWSCSYATNPHHNAGSTGIDHGINLPVGGSISLSTPAVNLLPAS